MLSACRCTFKASARGKWQDGIAITTEFCVSNVVVIIPDTAKSHKDVLKTVWDYNLDWFHSIDGSSLEAATAYFTKQEPSNA